jgi:hypothetical protein
LLQVGPTADHRRTELAERPANSIFSRIGLPARSPGIFCLRLSRLAMPGCIGHAKPALAAFALLSWQTVYHLRLV